MDEYVGIPRDHPESYHSYMWNNFFKFVDIDPANVNILDGNAPDLQVRRGGGVDLVVRRKNPKVNPPRSLATGAYIAGGVRCLRSENRQLRRHRALPGRHRT